MSATPKVSVVVLNNNGRRKLEQCFRSLQRLDYPRQELEILAVDNASLDGSVELIQRVFPDVRIVANDENVGIAQGNNAGARAATGEYVVFLDEGMSVDTGFVRALVNAVRERDGVVAAGAKILSHDGAEVEFGGGSINCTGHGKQLGLGEPHVGSRYDAPAPTAYASSAGMIVDRQVFLAVGGFDEDYFMLFEDVDLGWRLWLYGYEVRYAPNAIARRRYPAAVGAFDETKRNILADRNALATVLKNYEDRNAYRALSAAALAAAAGAVDGAEAAGLVDRSALARSLGGQILPWQLTTQDAVSLIALRALVASLPAIVEKRDAVQRRRVRSDAELARLFRPYAPRRPRATLKTWDAIAQATGMPELFADAPRRVLVFSPDVLPYPGFPTVGSGLRAWGLGNGLAAHGHEVLFSMPRLALDALGRPAPAEVEALAWRPFAMHEVVERTEPDVVVVCGWAVMESLAQDPFVEVPVVLDQHGPHMLERHYQGVGEFEDNSAQKRRALKAADFFSCAGDRQLGYFQDWLERAGWSDDERRTRSAAMPFSLSPELPERNPDRELTFVYGGVWLPWQDPSAGLVALVEQMNRRDRGILRLFGGRHPWIEIDGGVFERLVAELEASPRVVHEGQVNHAELIRRYTKAHVAIDLMKRNPERELAFTSRTVEFLWCGLPVLYNDYSELSDLIRDYDAGWTVDPEEPDQIRAALDEIFEQPELLAQKSTNARRLVRERLTWDHATDWLDHVVRSASARRNRVGFPRAAEPLPDRTLLDRMRRLYQLEGPAAVAAKGARVLIGTDSRYGWLPGSRTRSTGTNGA